MAIRQTNSVVFSLGGEAGAQQYLSASLDYLEGRGQYRRMEYPFPNVRVCCLLCGHGGCARWKGYYTRHVTCTLMNYQGPIAIHLAQCRTQGVDYTYWPEVLIPFRQPSVETLRLFYMTWFRKLFSIQAAIDEVVGVMEPEIFIPLSVAYLWLTYILKGLILNHVLLHVRAPESIQSQALRDYRLEDVLGLFGHGVIWAYGQHSIFIPP